jgi:putative ABC transport system ATP-binding protein
MSVVVQTVALRKTYRRGDTSYEALRGVDLAIHRGELVSIMGPSGSGKSTLLQLMGALDRPTSGSVRFGGEELQALSDRDLSRFRRRRLGFVFQAFHLSPMLTAEENVALPLILDGARASTVRDRARDLLAAMGLANRMRNLPHQLSGGEMQRVAIARALVGNPLAILADEPTGNLDSESGAMVLELLRDAVTKHGQTCIMVTHDREAARYGTRLIRVRDGSVEHDGPIAAATTSGIALVSPAGVAGAAAHA